MRGFLGTGKVDWANGHGVLGQRERAVVGSATKPTLRPPRRRRRITTCHMSYYVLPATLLSVTDARSTPLVSVAVNASASTSASGAGAGGAAHGTITSW